MSVPRSLLCVRGLTRGFSQERTTESVTPLDPAVDPPRIELNRKNRLYFTDRLSAGSGGIVRQLKTQVFYWSVSRKS